MANSSMVTPFHISKKWHSSRQQIGPHVSIEQEAELTKILQSLVNDNETLKRDNAELQHFLSDTREELHALQEEVDEQRANPQLFTPKLGKFLVPICHQP